jgi:DNA modification methylase
MPEIDLSDKKLNIQYIHIASLKKYERNAKKHPKNQIEILKKSIQQFGFRNPILIDNEHIVIAGHGRLIAAEELGLVEVPCILIDDLTPEQVKAYRIMDNKSQESGWDFELLKLDFQELKDLNFDLSTTGFTFGEIQKTGVSMFTEDEPELIDVSAYQRIKETTGVKRGDVYKLGNHWLMCGDSTSEADVSVLMAGNKADLCFTDPPYGVSIGSKNVMLNEFQKSGRVLENIEADTLSQEDLYLILVKAFKNIKTCSSEHCAYYVTAPQGGGLGMMMMMMKDAGLEVRHVLMWLKSGPTFSMGRLDYDYKHEPILYTWNENHIFYGNGEQKTSVWQYNKPLKNKEHPTMKPVELIINAIMNSSKEEDKVIDFFGGSGSTLIACEQTKRNCYMMEIDPVYIQVIIDRFIKLKGSQAEVWKIKADGSREQYLGIKG